MDEKSSHRDKVLFADLLDDLRRNGFSIGVDSYLRLQEVLARVGGRCTPDDLKTLLCPLFATNKKQQEFFYNAFDSYFNLTQAEGLEDSPPPQRPVPEPKVEPVWAKRWPYIVIGLLLTVIIAASSYYRERRVQINQGVNPQSRPAATPAPPPNLVTTVVTYLPVPEFIEPIRWIAFLIPLLIWLLYEWYLYNRRKLLLNKLSSDYQPHIFPFRPDTPPAIFTSDRFYNLARRLRRRQIAGHDLLDITETAKYRTKV